MGESHWGPKYVGGSARFAGRAGGSEETGGRKHFVADDLADRKRYATSPKSLLRLLQVAVTEALAERPGKPLQADQNRSNSTVTRIGRPRTS